MFKILIAGRTIDELRKNTATFLDSLSDDQIIDDDESQLELSPVAPPPSELLRRYEEPARSIPTPGTITVESAVDGAPSTAIVPATPSTAAPNDYGVDSRGWPWDERIHSTTQGYNKDGTWRNRRGVEPALMTQIESELAAKYGRGASLARNASINPVHVAPNPIGATPVPPTVPSSPFGAPTSPHPGFAPQSSMAPMTQAVPSSQPAPTLPSSHTAQTFYEHRVKVLAQLVTEGKLTQDYINQLKAYLKTDQIWNITPIQAIEMFENFVQAGMITRAQ